MRDNFVTASTVFAYGATLIVLIEMFNARTPMDAFLINGAYSLTAYGVLSILNLRKKKRE